jgi:uncharacterized protein (DUF697 family)/predicted GTPase
MFYKVINNEWIDQFLNPKLPDDILHERLHQSLQLSPIPAIWLLGKTQSGKSSIVHALTGSSYAEIGQGFRPCTRQSASYDFPDAETAFVRFIDTRGLGEAAYDPAEDIAYCMNQAHLLMVVIKAMDHELDSVLTVTKAIRDAHPEWPMIVVQTCLHEGYPNKSMAHIQPYPFADDVMTHQCPVGLSRSLAVQRQQFKGFNGVSFVAVDLTQPEDDYQPINYGLEQLWSAIELALPVGLQQLIKQDSKHSSEINDECAQHAYPHVVSYAISSGLLALTPVPGVSLSLVIATQAKLFQSIASIYGVALTKRSVSEVIGAVGMGGLATSLGVRELGKIIPGGSVVAAVSTAAITYALGMTLCYYYGQSQQGHVVTAAMIKANYEAQLMQGRELLKQRFTKGG